MAKNDFLRLVSCVFFLKQGFACVSVQVPAHCVSGDITKSRSIALNCPTADHLPPSGRFPLLLYFYKCLMSSFSPSINFFYCCLLLLLLGNFFSIILQSSIATITSRHIFKHLLTLPHTSISSLGKSWLLEVITKC